MSFEDLINTRAQVVAAIELHTARERQALMNFLEKTGVNGARKASVGKPLKGRKLLPKYRNPDDLSQVWAGRGLKPKWLTAALKKRGVTLESFSVK